VADRRADGTCDPSLSFEDIYPFDHVYPRLGSEAATTAVILYSPLGTSEFFAFHTLLAQLARDGTIK
jgi:hypothetical protein